MTLNRDKVFCIGLNKTGTTSIGDALEVLGYRRLGWDDLTSRRLTHAWCRQDIDSFIRICSRYDAFEDIPWPLVYKEMAAAFPSAKFILTTRSSEEKWLSSVSKHTIRRKWLGHKMIYGSYEVESNKKGYSDVYRDHNESVMKFFENCPERLYVCCIDNNSGWNELCSFLNIKRAPSIPFPKSNATSSLKDFLGIQYYIQILLHLIELLIVFLFFNQSFKKAMHSKSIQGSKKD